MLIVFVLVRCNNVGQTFTLLNHRSWYCIYYPAERILMERKTYYLNLAALIQQFGQQSITLYTAFSRGVPGLVEPCIGTVQVQEGRIVECSIEGRSGASINGTAAFQLLRAVAVWQVQARTDKHSSVSATPSNPTPPSLPQMSSSLDAIIPQRNMPLLPGHLDGLGAKERIVLRSVLALINGQRSVEQIKTQMHLPPETVERVLWQLHRMQIIVW
jgi:hypothetical protein